MNATVAKWLEQLAADSVRVVDDLVMGRIAVPVWSRASLGEIFLEVVEAQAGALDAGVAAWLEGHLQKLPPQQLSNEVWSSYLQDLFRAVTSLSLPRVARLLGTRRREFQAWLRPLVREASLDPEAAYLTALAWCEHNQHLEGFWRNLALRNRNEPEYYTDIALLGLRKLRDDAGQLPPKAPHLLLATLLDLADGEGMTQPVWERKTRTVLAGYRLSADAWAREFKEVLTAHGETGLGSVWLRKIVPIPTAKVESASSRYSSASPQFTLDECNDFVDVVRQCGPSVEPAPLNGFLKRHRDYASRSNNPHFLVRTFNRLASAAKEHDPDWAVARIEEALAWDPGNAKNWTVLAQCHWSRRQAALRQQQTDRARVAESDAFDAQWEARRRFPYDAVVRTELARFHKDAGDLQTAELLYREAIAEFPLNPVPRCGLADVKRLMGDTVEAERLYRAVITEFPTNPYAYNGLAEILFGRSRHSGNAAERDEARSLFQKAADLGDKYAINFLDNRFDKEWHRGERRAKKRTEPETTASVAQLLSQNEADMGPAQRLGRALLALWQAAHCTRNADRQPFLDRADSLLTMPDALTGECHQAFLEARGYLLLASAKHTEARDYFVRQLERAAPQRPAGLELGLAEARRALHENTETDSAAALPARRFKSLLLPLVLKVVEWCQIQEQDDLLRDALLAAFPSVRDQIAKSQSIVDDEHESHREESADAMLAGFLHTNIFQLAGIESADDLRDSNKLADIKKALRLCEADLRSITHQLVMAA